jgi:hypothetical protein
MRIPQLSDVRESGSDAQENKLMYLRKASQKSGKSRSDVKKPFSTPSPEMLVPVRTEQSLRCPGKAAQPSPKSCSSVRKTPLKCPENIAEMPKRGVQSPRKAA